MKKFIVFLYVLGFSSISNGQVVIPINEGTNEICQQLNALFNGNSDVSVCLIKTNQDQAAQAEKYLYTIDLIKTAGGCNILSLEGTQELKIPSRTRIRLVDGFQIKLSDNASITGDHFATSQIMIGSGGSNNTDTTPFTALDMSDCLGCSVSGVTIGSENNNNNDPLNIRTGMNIGSGGNNEVNEVRIRDIDNGIVVDGGSGNEFNDLQFFRVARDASDCDPLNNETAGLHLIASNNNQITNITHIRSPGAVTVKLEGQCDHNTILNVSVEQEESHCIEGGDDPALYIDNAAILNNITGNIITCNFNHAKTVVEEATNVDICVNNKISDIANCNTANIQMGCSTN